MTQPLPSLNDATASLLRAAYGDSRHTLASLARSVGLPRRSVWELLTTAAPLDLADVSRLAAALALDPVALLSHASDLCEGTGA